MLKKYFGDKAFVKRVLLFALPIILQNGISTFVNLLDNIMVGRVGTLEMSGVSVVNSLLLIFNLCVFGVNSGAGIFTAQFHGSSDLQGIRHTMRYKLFASLGLALVAIGIFLPLGQPLIRLYLTGEGDPADAVKTLGFGWDYLTVMLFGFVPFALTNVYASTLRECGESRVPMLSGVAAMLVNLVLNYVFIFGHLGAPRMGVRGAALATVISRYVELGILVVWAHTHTGKYPFIRGVFASLRIPGRLVWAITRKGAPLLVNEFLWSSSIAVLMQCYSTCGLDVVPAVNISETVNNFASVVAIALASSVGILMGQMMGAGRPKEEILDANRKLLLLSGVFGIGFGVLLAAAAPVFPLLYNTSEQVRTLATRLILVLALMKPAMSYLISIYHTLRSGGKTLMTFIFDSGTMWAVTIPLVFLLSQATSVPILVLYAVAQGVDVLRCVLGWFLVRKGNWIQNLSTK